MSGSVERASGPGSTVGSFWRELAVRLSAVWGEGARDSRTASLDARLIVAHAMGVDASSLALREHDPVRPAARESALAMTERRSRGEPIARIVGQKEFWGLPFRLSRGTLVPRPDTETLVSVAIDAIATAGRRSESLRLLDLGTGSGCILLAMLSELPQAKGLGVDCDEDAVATASENAQRLGLVERASFVVGDWTENIAGPFDVILANPPYIEDDALPGLPIEVVGFDPDAALAGGPDGLASYRQIIPKLPALMAESGFVVLEFGPHQARFVTKIAESVGLVATVKSDLAGRERATLLTLS